MQNYYITACDDNGNTMIHVWVTLWKTSKNNNIMDIKTPYEKATDM